MAEFARRHPTFVRLYVPVVVTLNLVVFIVTVLKGCAC